MRAEVLAEMTDGDNILTPAEVALMLRVDPKTVTRWANKEKMVSFRTPGGHRRFWESDIRKLMQPQLQPQSHPEAEVSA